jgi:hypothetical protein
LLEHDPLRISERWRTRTAQSARLIGNHRVEVNIDMRAANVVAPEIESLKKTKLQKIKKNKNKALGIARDHKLTRKTAQNQGLRVSLARD